MDRVPVIPHGAAKPVTDSYVSAFFDVSLMGKAVPAVLVDRP